MQRLALSNRAVLQQNTLCKMDSWSYFYITIGVYIVIVLICFCSCVLYFDKCTFGFCRNCKKIRTLNTSIENVEANRINGLNENTTQPFPEYRRGLHQL